MNKGVSPVGINNSIGFKATKVKPSNIDIAYEKELIAIRKRKQASDVFEKINLLYKIKINMFFLTIVLKWFIF